MTAYFSDRESSIEERLRRAGVPRPDLLCLSKAGKHHCFLFAGHHGPHKALQRAVTQVMTGGYLNVDRVLRVWE